MFDIITTGRKSARRLWAAAEKAANALLAKPRTLIRHFNDGARMSIYRGEKREQTIRLGPNCVHAFITHPDGSIDDLGLSMNLMTNIGCDVLSGAMGGFLPAGNTNAADISSLAPTATTITGTGSVWTASNLATPQLGLTGNRVYAAPHTTTLPVVYGNVVSNTTNVITVDKWWNADDTTGTTPSNGDAFIIGRGGLASVRFMALTLDAAAAAKADTVLASEITANGCGRALATYAHTFGQTTFTLQKAYSATGTETAVVKMGLFCALSSAGADPMIFEGTFSSANLLNGDTLTVTDTVTLVGN